MSTHCNITNTKPLAVQDLGCIEFIKRATIIEQFTVSWQRRIHYPNKEPSTATEKSFIRAAQQERKSSRVIAVPHVNYPSYLILGALSL